MLESSRRAPGVYERKVVMHARAEELMQVCWSGVLAEVAAAAAARPPRAIGAAARMVTVRVRFRVRVRVRVIGAP